MDKKMKWQLVAAAAVLFAGVVSSAIAASPAGMKLYVFSSGALTIGRGVLQNFGPMDPPIQVPVGFFVIKHPKGNILFDTGNNDKIIDNFDYWPKGMQSLDPVRTPDVAIDVQLRKIGMSPDDIKFVVVSHMHLDHGGNVGKFPHSTLIIQRDEIDYANFPDEPFNGPFIREDMWVLRAANGSGKPNAMNMVILNQQDYDIFRDGSVVVKYSRGHTKGHQMMVVRLPKQGTTILTGDNVYFRENVDKHIPPNLVLAYDPAAIMKSYDYLREMMAMEGADYFTAHDPDAYKAMKHAPEYYE